MLILAFTGQVLVLVAQNLKRASAEPEKNMPLLMCYCRGLYYQDIYECVLGMIITHSAIINRIAITIN